MSSGDAYVVYVHFPLAIAMSLGVYGYYLYNEEEGDFYSDFKEKMMWLGVSCLLFGPILPITVGLLYLLRLCNNLFKGLIYFIKSKKLKSYEGRLISSRFDKTRYIILKAETSTRWLCLGPKGKILAITHMEAEIVDEKSI